MSIFQKLRPALAALLLLCQLASTGDACAKSHPVQERIIVAYVTSWSEVLPDPKYMTHINYAFGHVNETFDGVRIDNPERLRQLVALKQQAPQLKIQLSVGGWGSGRFSEMAADSQKRKAFAADCRRVVEEYGLDGIDIDWEYPTSKAAGISASPQDTENFTLLMRDLRRALGKQPLLTLATVASAQYIHFKKILPYIDFVNIMSYDMGNAPRHHAGLYPSEHTGWMTASQAVEAHLAAGVPASKLTMGLPFYGRGGAECPDFTDYREVEQWTGKFTTHWDSVAQVPYLANAQGELVLGYENPRSLAGKCRYIVEHNLLGGMYWEYAGDTDEGELRRTLYENLLGGEPSHRVLVITEGGGQHGPFSDEALRWIEEEGRSQSFRMEVIHNATPITDDYLSQFQLIIQLDFPPYTWPEEAEAAFMRYIDEGRGGWIGFHHATLLGEFDGYPMWQWFSDFMGGIRFRNYIAPLADGQVTVERPEHPIMRGVPASFLLQDDEWYTYDRSPRPHVQVLAHVDESTYRPASEITMGDHPVVWVNEGKKARNVYFQMGHSPKLFQSEAFTEMFRNAIRWSMR